MNKILLTLFTPIICFAQITLQDILAIDSESSYKRAMIENGFSEKEMDEELDLLIGYKKELTFTEIHSTFRKADSLMLNGGIRFMFTPDFTYKKNEVYDKIYDEVKKSCKFSEIREDSSGDLAYYRCPDIDADPRLVKLNELIHKNIENSDKSINITDIEIGFTRFESLYMIELPLTFISNEKMIDLVTKLYEFGLEKQKNKNGKN